MSEVYAGLCWVRRVDKEMSALCSDGCYAELDAHEKRTRNRNRSGSTQPVGTRAEENCKRKEARQDTRQTLEREDGDSAGKEGGRMKRSNSRARQGSRDESGLSHSSRPGQLASGLQGSEGSTSVCKCASASLEVPDLGTDRAAMCAGV